MPHRAYPGRNQRAKQNAQASTLRGKYKRKKRKNASGGKSGGAAIGGAAGGGGG